MGYMKIHPHSPPMGRISMLGWAILRAVKEKYGVLMERVGRRSVVMDSILRGLLVVMSG